MPKILIPLFVLALLLPQLAAAQPAGFKPVANTTAFKAALSQSTHALESFSSPFMQEKKLSMLASATTASGQFYYKKTNKVRMEYTSPYRYVMVMNNGRVKVVDDKAGTAARQGRAFRQINQMIAESLNGSALSNTDFNVSVFENNSHYVMVMAPLNKSLQRFIKSVSVYVTRSNMLVETIEMQDPSGDKTSIKFTARKTNLPLSDALFTVQ